MLKELSSCCATLCFFVAQSSSFDACAGEKEVKHTVWLKFVGRTSYKIVSKFILN